MNCEITFRKPKSALLSVPSEPQPRRAGRLEERIDTGNRMVVNNSMSGDASAIHLGS